MHAEQPSALCVNPRRASAQDQQFCRAISVHPNEQAQECKLRYALLHQKVADMTTIQGARVPGVKMDPDNKPGNGWIKTEPDLITVAPALQPDEDIYEDAGDLDFATSSQSLYLTRVPKMLWENWSQLDDDQEILLGTVRVEGPSNQVNRVSYVVVS